MFALKKSKEMAVARPRTDRARVNPNAVLRNALDKYPRTMAHLGK